MKFFKIELFLGVMSIFYDICPGQARKNPQLVDALEVTDGYESRGGACKQKCLRAGDACRTVRYLFLEFDGERKPVGHVLEEGLALKISELTGVTLQFSYENL